MIKQLNDKTSDTEAAARRVPFASITRAMTRTEAIREVALGLRLDRLTEYYWAGRHPAHRKSARFAA